MVGLYATEHYVLVHLVVEDFGMAGSQRHCWEDLFVDCFPAVDCCLNSRVSYSLLALVGYWGLVGWDGFVVQTPIPMEKVELGQGLEWLIQLVRSRLGGKVPKMWEFFLYISMSTKLMPGPAAVAQLVHKKLWLHIGTSFLHSMEFSFGRKH